MRFNTLITVINALGMAVTRILFAVNTALVAVHFRTQYTSVGSRSRAFETFREQAIRSQNVAEALTRFLIQEEQHKTGSGPQLSRFNNRQMQRYARRHRFEAVRLRELSDQVLAAPVLTWN